MHRTAQLDCFGERSTILAKKNSTRGFQTVCGQSGLVRQRAEKERREEKIMGQIICVFLVGKAMED